MKGRQWETFDHMADIGVRGFGTTPAEAFENGAKAVFSMMVEEFSAIEPRQGLELRCSSFDLAGLFVAWINELLAKSDLSGMVFCDFCVKIDVLELEGSAIGEEWVLGKHGRGVEVKGATFSEALVREEGGCWIAQCIVDV